MNPAVWCQSLENVLDDGDAFQAFHSWVKGENAEHPLRLHFSVVAFKEMIRKQDTKSQKLTEEIFKKYLDPRDGVCQFINLSTRQQIGQKLMSSTIPLEESLFDPCLPYIDAFLRKQHAQFVTSDAFIEFLNSNPEEIRPSTSALKECPPAAACTPIASRRQPNSRNNKHKELLSTKKLTAETLLRSQYERDRILGQRY
jgi:hypothetical protein